MDFYIFWLLCNGSTSILSCAAVTQFPCVLWIQELRVASLAGGRGGVPRGAGIIAFRLLPNIASEDPLAGWQVCLVEKADKWMCSQCRTSMYSGFAVRPSCKNASYSYVIIIHPIELPHQKIQTSTSAGLVLVRTSSKNGRTGFRSECTG